MNSDWVDEMIATATAMFNKWRGVRVKFWDYTATHRKLTLRIESSTTTGNLHLVCGGCNHIRGPFSWDSSNFTIRRSDGKDGRVFLVDEQVGFELLCDIISVEEEVEPGLLPSTRNLIGSRVGGFRVGVEQLLGEKSRRKKSRAS